MYEPLLCIANEIDSPGRSEILPSDTMSVNTDDVSYVLPETLDLHRDEALSGADSRIRHEFVPQRINNLDTVTTTKDRTHFPSNRSAISSPMSSRRSLRVEGTLMNDMISTEVQHT
jgi:hypothetical protein